MTPWAIIHAKTSAYFLLDFFTPDRKKLASKVSESKFKTEEEKVQNNNV